MKKMDLLDDIVATPRSSKSMREDEDEIKSILTNNNQIQVDNRCYGFRCSKKSTEKIEVSAGKFGEITLYLCSVCATKFKPKEM